MTESGIRCGQALLFRVLLSTYKRPSVLWEVCFEGGGLAQGLGGWLC